MLARCAREQLPGMRRARSASSARAPQAPPRPRTDQAGAARVHGRVYFLAFPKVPLCKDVGGRSQTSLQVPL